MIKYELSPPSDPPIYYLDGNLEKGCWYKVVKAPDSQQDKVGTCIFVPIINLQNDIVAIAFVENIDYPSLWYKTCGYVLNKLSKVDISIRY